MYKRQIQAAVSLTAATTRFAMQTPGLKSVNLMKSLSGRHALEIPLPSALNTGRLNRSITMMFWLRPQVPAMLRRSGVLKELTAVTTTHNASVSF